MPLIDTQQFESLCQLAAGDNDFIASVIDAFLPQLERIPGEVREALAGGDEEDVARLAHSLKGSSANVGAQDVSEICRNLEKAARGGDLSAAGALADQLEEVARETWKAYEAEKARLT